MFIIYVKDLPIKNKMYRGSYFYKNKKCKPLEREKKFNSQSFTGAFF